MLPVIISGGAGTRLWPVSRASLPKPFCAFWGQESLLAGTISRLKRFGDPWVLTIKDLEVLTVREMKASGINSPTLLLEPFGKNTAAAVAFLCKALLLRGEANTVVGVFPADHLVQKNEAFWNALMLAEECAKKEQVVTLGIRPSYAATGYGYIETTGQVFASGKDLEAQVTLGFREKPQKSKAEEFIRAGRFFWNAGIFVFKAEVMAKHLSTFMPALWKTVNGLKADYSNLKEIYSAVESISIDYAVMEKLKEQVCIPCDIGWNDVGSWDEVSAVPGPAKNAHVYQHDAKGNFVYSEDSKKVFALVGTEDLIVVDTPDATLISKKGVSQQVKDVLAQAQKQKEKAATEHPFEFRPWGKFEILRDSEYYKSKVIRVEPGQQLSYQSHAKRAEHWIAVKGQGEVVLNDETVVFRQGEHVFIPMGAKHRVRNPFDKPLEFIEVQVGTYFGEDDIVRYTDDYGRK